MSKPRLALIVAPGAPPTWDGGDSVIRQGFVQLFRKELEAYDLQWIEPDLPASEDWSGDELVLPSVWAKTILPGAQALVKVGTPNWWNQRDRALYRTARNLGIPVSLAGIGLGHRWGVEDGGRISTTWDETHQFRVVVCRDPHTMTWWQALSTDTPLRLLPCPGFYALSPQWVRRKHLVLLGVCPASHMEKIGAFNAGHYAEYLRALGEIKRGLAHRGCAVTLWFECPADPVDVPLLAEYGLSGPFTVATTAENFSETVQRHEVVISARVHGVLPAAGAGIPTYGLGIDLRQFAWEVPVWIARQDIRAHKVNPDWVLQWWDEMDPALVSAALRMTRLHTGLMWRALWPQLAGG